MLSLPQTFAFQVTRFVNQAVEVKGPAQFDECKKLIQV